MSTRHTIIFCVLLALARCSPVPALADWQVYPETNWTYQPHHSAQLWSGVCERLSVMLPTNQDPYPLKWREIELELTTYIGTTNTIFTNAGYVYTNTIPIYTNIWVTNQFYPYVYSLYSHVSTNFVDPVNYSRGAGASGSLEDPAGTMCDQIEHGIDSVIMRNPDSVASLFWWWAAPWETNTIGRFTNIATACASNYYKFHVHAGIPTNGSGLYYRYFWSAINPGVTTQGYKLAEFQMAATNTGNPDGVFIDVSRRENYNFDDSLIAPKPVLWWVTTNTIPTNLTLTISGIGSTSETVVVSGQSMPLAQYWNNVTSITSVNAHLWLNSNQNIGDVGLVIYTNPIVNYTRELDMTLPIHKRWYPQWFNEHAKVLNYLYILVFESLYNPMTWIGWEWGVADKREAVGVAETEAGAIAAAQAAWSGASWGSVGTSVIPHHVYTVLQTDDDPVEYTATFRKYRAPMRITNDVFTVAFPAWQIYATTNPGGFGINSDYVTDRQGGFWTNTPAGNSAVIETTAKFGDDDTAPFQTYIFNNEDFHWYGWFNDPTYGFKYWRRED